MALGLALASNAYAMVMTFASLTQPGASFNFLLSGTYSEGGFTVSTISGNEFGAPQTGNTAFYAGSTGLAVTNPVGGSGIMLAKTGGGSFDLASIDLAPLSVANIGGGASVAFVGNLSVGGTVNQSFAAGSTMAFQTFSFSGFSNLSSVTWNQAAPYHQFSNISVTAVPEAHSYSMLLIGLGVMGFIVRRRKLAPG